MNRNQQRDRPLETAELDLEKTEMSTTQAELDVLDVIEIDLSIESNTDYSDPFSGMHLPAGGEEPVLPDEDGSYKVDDLFVFGDRLTENGGEFGKNAVAESTGANPPYDFAPYSPLGNFTNGLNWTTYLAGTLGIEDYTDRDSNFSYLDATSLQPSNY